MNRIQMLASPKQPLSPVSEVYQAVLQSGSKAGCDYSLFAPLHYEPKYKYPLLIWLHSTNTDERQIQRVMPLISMRNYVGIAPRGPECVGHSGHDWGSSSATESLAAQSIFDSIEIAREKFCIAPDRIFLGGYQSGGTMAFRIAMSHPQQFAGVLSIDGPFPNCEHSLGPLEDARQLPMFIAVGEQAEIYPIDRACEDLRLFHTAGLSVDLRQYPCGDEIVSRMLIDLDRWMMERITGAKYEPENLTYTPLKSWN